MNVIFETSHERGLAVLLVTHSLELAARTQPRLGARRDGTSSQPEAD